MDVEADDADIIKVITCGDCGSETRRTIKTDMRVIFVNWLEKWAKLSNLK